VLSIGISVDPDQFYDANTDKYEVEGPKNMYDFKMLIGWLQKLIADHPLISYVEDAIRVGDVAGWQQWCQLVKEQYEHVQTGVSKWFESDLETIKEHTMMEPEDSEEEEEEEA